MSPALPGPLGIVRHASTDECRYCGETFPAVVIESKRGSWVREFHECKAKPEPKRIAESVRDFFDDEHEEGGIGA